MLTKLKNVLINGLATGQFFVSNLVVKFFKNGLMETVIKDIRMNDKKEIVLDFIYSENLSKEITDMAEEMKNTGKSQIYDDFVQQIKDTCIEIMSKEKIADKIFFKIEKDKETLKRIPHQDFLDLAFVPHILVDKNTENDLENFDVTNVLMKTLNLDEKFLFECAEKNTQHIIPVKIREYTDPDTSGGYIINDIENEERVTKQIKNIVENTKGLKAWSIFSPIKDSGAVHIKNVGILQAFADICNDNLVIIPLSYHEMMIMPKNIATSSFCTLMGKARDKIIPNQNKISDNFYIFDKEEKTFQIVKEI